MARYKIKDAEGNVVSIIKADLDFVQNKYEFFEEDIRTVHPEEKNIKERLWRDQELDRTDKFMMLNDYPAQRDQAMRTYRQALRDWPDTPDFPDKRPTL